MAAVGVAGCGEKTEPQLPKARASQAGGGDEQPLRQPVRVTVTKSAIKPARSQVDAFLGIRLVVRNTSGRKQRVVVPQAKLPRAVEVGAGKRASLEMEGLRPGSYRIEGSPTKGRANLVVKRTKP